MPGIITAANAGQEILQCFWDLAAVDEAKRVAAAAALVEHIAVEGPGKLVPLSAKDVAALPQASSAKLDAVLAGCSPSAAYVLKRLVNGLASGRAAARQGFSIALAACLEALPGFGAIRALAMLDACLETTGSMKGNEVRDVLLGRVFGTGAIVRSGAVADASEAAVIAQELVAVANKKSFLKEAACMVLLELGEGLPGGALAAMVEDAPSLAAWLTTDLEAASPEALLLALRFWAALPAPTLKACRLLPKGAPRPPPDLFTPSSSLPDPEASRAAAAAFFSAAHMTALRPILIASHASHPRLHLLWTTLFALLVPGFTVKKDEKARGDGGAEEVGPGQLETLWSVVVEDGLFAGTSHERKALGFKLFGLLLPHVRAHHVPAVFSRGFLHCLVSNINKPDNYLHSAAKRTLERLAETATAQKELGDGPSGSQVRMAIVTTLQRFGGSGFDRLTKSKTVARLLQGMDAEGLSGYLAELRQQFLACEGKLPVEGADGEGSKADDRDDSDAEGKEAAGGESPSDGQQRWLLEQVCSATHLPAATTEIRFGAAAFLATHAFLQPAKQKKVTVPLGGSKVDITVAPPSGAPLTPKLRQVCAARLLSLLAGAGRQPGPQQAAEPKPSAGGGQQAAGELLEAVEAFLAAAAKQKGLPTWRPEEGEAPSDAAEWGFASGTMAKLQGACQEAGKVLSKAAAAGGSSSALTTKAHSMQALLRYLQLYGRCMVFLPEEAPLLEEAVAEDIATCCSPALGGKEKITKWAHESQYMLEVESGSWTYVLLDCLLLLLRQPWEPLPAAPLRDCAEAVFRAFAETAVSWNGFTHLMRIVISGDDTEVGEEGEAQEEEEEAGDESMDEDEDEGSDEEEDSDEEEEEVKEEGGGKEWIDDGSDEEELPDMDDEAMFRMDKAVAAHLRNLQNAKARRRADAEARLNFKLRVASLLEAFARRAPAAEVLPEAALHLYEALRRAEAALGRSGTAAAVLQQRVEKILRVVCASKAEGSAAARSYEQCASEVEGAQGVARYCARTQDKKMLELGQAVVLYLWRVALAPARSGDPSLAEGCCSASPTKVVESALALLHMYMNNKKCRLKLRFFETAGNIHPTLRKELLAKSVEHACTARSSQLQAEAMSLAGALLRVPKDKREQLAPACHLSSTKKAWEKMIVHSVCGDWKPVKCQADALKHSCAAVRAARTLDVDPKPSVSTKGTAAILEASGPLVAHGSKRVASCLKQLLGLLGIEVPLQAKKSGARPKSAAAETQDSDSEEDEDEVVDDVDSDSGDDGSSEEEAPRKGKKGGKAGKEGASPHKGGHARKTKQEGGGGRKAKRPRT